MFKKSILLGILALAFVTLAAGEVLAWGIQFGGYGCLSGGCSYEGDITIVGAKGQSVDAGTLVGMLQTVQEGHIVGFCINPQGKLNPSGTAFHKVAVQSFEPADPNRCGSKGKCPVEVHQVTNLGDLPQVCSGTLCPAVCNNGANNGTPPPPADTGEQCLGKIYGINVDTACNNNFSFFGVVWDQVNLEFDVIDPLSATNPVATLNVTCTSPDGLVFPQPSPFQCVVPKK